MLRALSMLSRVYAEGLGEASDQGIPRKRGTTYSNRLAARQAYGVSGLPHWPASRSSASLASRAKAGGEGGIGCYAGAAHSRCARPISARGLAPSNAPPGVLIPADVQQAYDASRGIRPAVAKPMAGSLRFWFDLCPACHTGLPAVARRVLRAERRLAERGGFEPPVPLRVHVISNHAHSTTLSPLRVLRPTLFAQAVRWAKGETRRSSQQRSTEIPRNLPGHASRETCLPPSVSEI